MEPIYRIANFYENDYKMNHMKNCTSNQNALYTAGMTPRILSNCLFFARKTIYRLILSSVLE